MRKNKGVSFVLCGAPQFRDRWFVKMGGCISIYIYLHRINSLLLILKQGSTHAYKIVLSLFSYLILVCKHGRLFVYGLRLLTFTLKYFGQFVWIWPNWFWEKTIKLCKNYAQTDSKISYYTHKRPHEQVTFWISYILDVINFP